MIEVSNRIFAFHEGNPVAFNFPRAFTLWAKALGASPMSVVVVDREEQEFVAATATESDGVWTIKDPRGRLYLQGTPIALEDRTALLVASIFEDLLFSEAPWRCNMVKLDEWIMADQWSEWGINHPTPGFKVSYCPELIAELIRERGAGNPEDLGDYVAYLVMLVTGWEGASGSGDERAASIVSTLAERYPSLSSASTEVFA